MRIMKRAFVSGFACAAAACAMVSFAQDDLDSLLNDLESDGKKKAAPAVAKPAEAAVQAAEEAKPAAESVPALEEVKPVEEPKVVEAAPVAETAVAEAAPAAESAPAAEAAPVAVAEAKKPAESGASEKEVANFLDDLARVPGQAKSEAAPAVAEVTPAPAAAAAPAPVAKEPVDPNAALVSDLMATESLRREAMDIQAARELSDAREAMSARDWDLAHRKYSLAFKHLNDREDTVALRRECAQGMAEARYQAEYPSLRDGGTL